MQPIVWSRGALYILWQKSGELQVSVCFGVQSLLCYVSRFLLVKANETKFSTNCATVVLVCLVGQHLQLPPGLGVHSSASWQGLVQLQVI